MEHRAESNPTVALVVESPVTGPKAPVKIGKSVSQDVASLAHQQYHNHLLTTGQLMSMDDIETLVTKKTKNKLFPTMKFLKFVKKEKERECVRKGQNTQPFDFKDEKDAPKNENDFVKWWVYKSTAYDKSLTSNQLQELKEAIKMTLRIKRSTCVDACQKVMIGE